VPKQSGYAACQLKQLSGAFAKASDYQLREENSGFNYLLPFVTRTC